MMSGVTQGSVLGPLLLIIYINYLDLGINREVSNCIMVTTSRITVTALFLLVLLVKMPSRLRFCEECNEGFASKFPQTPPRAVSVSMSVYIET